MTYRHILPLAVALVAAVVPLRIVQAEGGGLSGNLINQTTAAPVPDQLLQLHVTRSDGTEAPTLAATSGPDGTFAFEGVDLAPGTQFALCTTYQGAMYHDPFEAPADGSPLSRDLAVYEATDSAEAIAVTSAHVIFYPNPEQSVVEVLEFLMFQNSGDRTYVEAGEGGEGNPGETLHFTLPEGAASAALHQGLSEDQVQWHEGGFCSLAPVYPGEQEIVYYYVLPYPKKGSLRFVRPLDRRPPELLVMTSGNQGQVTGRGIVSQGPVDVQGEGQFGLYRATLSPSQTALDLELSGLGGGSAAGVNFRILAGGLVGVGLIGALFVAVVLKRRRALAPARAPAAPVEADDPEEGGEDDGEPA